MGSGKCSFIFAVLSGADKDKWKLLSGLPDFLTVRKL
jgi:hypothetical protein